MLRLHHKRRLEGIAHGEPGGRREVRDDRGARGRRDDAASQVQRRAASVEKPPAPGAGELVQPGREVFVGAEQNAVDSELREEPVAPRDRRAMCSS